MRTRPHLDGPPKLRELYSEAAAAEVQVAMGHLRLEREVDNVAHMAHFGEKKKQDYGGREFFFCSLSEL